MKLLPQDVPPVTELQGQGQGQCQGQGRLLKAVTELLLEECKEEVLWVLLIRTLNHTQHTRLHIMYKTTFPQFTTSLSTSFHISLSTQKNVHALRKNI